MRLANGMSQHDVLIGYNICMDVLGMVALNDVVGAFLDDLLR